MRTNDMRSIKGSRASATQRIRRSPIALAVLLALGTTTAVAQTVTGGVDGNAPPGDTVQVTSPDTGVTRNIIVSPTGRFRVTGLNPGLYEVQVSRDGKAINSVAVIVRAGLMTSSVSVAPAVTSNSKNIQTLNAVEVTANSAQAMKFDVSPIDVRTPQLISHYSRLIVNDLPISNNAQSIALLNSNVTLDSQTSGGVQLNGATAAENHFYLNGFDITNDSTNIGSLYVPSDAISSTNVIDGNFDASWSSTTGGVLSQTVRQGSNVFKGGYTMYYTPPTSRLFNPMGRMTLNSIGQPYTYTSAASHTAPNITQDFWVSGPIVKNKLFGFAMFGQTLPRTSTNYSCCSVSTSSNRDRNGIVNLTWNITNNQSLDVLADRNSQSSYYQSYNLGQLYTPSSKESVSTGWSSPSSTQTSFIGDYTWNVTDNFEMHLMAGYAESNSQDMNSTEAENVGPYVATVNPVTQITTIIGPSSSYYSYFPSGYTERGYKADFDWWVGNNKISFGAQDYQDLQIDDFGSNVNGVWTYYDEPGQILANGSTVPSSNGNYVQQAVYKVEGTIKLHEKSMYVQDSLQVTPRWLLYGGLRWDSNTYLDGNGEPFATMPLFSPRLGFAWDVNGNSSFKVGGSIGRYTIALPLNFSAGVGISDIYYQNFYTYTGRTAQQVPTGLTQIGSSYVTANGQPIGPAQVGQVNLKAPYEYAANLYMQKKLHHAWSANAGIGVTDLKRVIDQTCEEANITAFAQAHGFPNYNASTITNPCFEVNPGTTAVLVRDFAGNGKLQELTVPGSALGILGPSHKYYNLTLSLAHQPTQARPYFLNLSYTFARSYGNTDGLLDLSHRDPGYIGQDDVFEYPGLQVDSTGNLADDIRNQFVASGIYYFGGDGHGLHVGGVLHMNTGAPISCLGTYPDAGTPANLQGPVSYFCDGIPHPLGSNRLPFMWSLGVDVGYDWKLPHHQRISANLQIQNVTNHQGINDLVQTFDTGQMINQTQAIPNVNYLAATLTPPRSTMLVIRYSF